MKLKSIIFAILTLAIHQEIAHSQTSETLAEDSEQVAISKIKSALAKVEKSFTADNIANALAVTEQNGGLDNEAVIAPWIDFIEKYHNKIFIATDGQKNPGATGLRLYLVATYYLENGPEIKNPAEAKSFRKSTEKLGLIVDP